MIGGHGLHLSAPPPSAVYRRYPPILCALTKRGQRLLSSIATTAEPSASVSLLRKFAASSSKHVTLTTLSHLLAPSTAHPRLSSLAFSLYSMIEQESWFKWNAKLVTDLIALLYKEERFDEAENLLTETVLKVGFKERDLCMFYCNLVDSHAKRKSEKGVLDSCAKLRQLILLSTSVYVKQRGYESMVAGFCEAGLPNKAEILMQEMREKRLKISVFEFRSLVYGYGQAGFLEDMKRIVVQMENEGFELDTVSYNMILSSFGAQNELLNMLTWLEKMRNSGITLSVRTYNTVLNSCPNLIFLLQDMKELPLSVNELVHNVSKAEADLVMELLKSSVLDEVMAMTSSELKLDLHGMHLSTAYLILLQWFIQLRLRFVDGDQSPPAEILLVRGCGKHSSKRGESPVRHLAKEMIVRMKCPLRVDRKNVGCFIGKGKAFKDWLCQYEMSWVMRTQ